jgi:hypothetical protein
MSDDDDLKSLPLDDAAAQEARRLWGREQVAMAQTDRDHHEQEVARLTQEKTVQGPGGALLGGVGFVLLPVIFYLNLLAFEAITGSTVAAFCATAVFVSAGLSAGLIGAWDALGLPEGSEKAMRAGFVGVSGLVMMLGAQSAWGHFWYWPLGLLAGMCLVMLPTRSIGAVSTARCAYHRRLAKRASDRLAHYSAQTDDGDTPEAREVGHTHAE